MRRIGLLGGSFNPPHLGHQMICLWVLSTEQVDEVWLLPTFRHPFGKALADFQHRLEMCRRATACLAPGSVQVSSLEAELGGESRTLYTVQHLVRQHPDCRFRLVFGADILQEKDSWYRFEEIERLAPPLVVGRVGFPSVEVRIELPGLSSTRIRQLLAEGGDVSAWVPAPVLEYIRAHRLYQEGEEGGAGDGS